MRQSQKIRKGDYVAHRDFGIALFNGLRRGDDGDWLILTYSDRTIRIPVAQSGKLTKYTRIDGLPPKLSVLSGTSWQTAKEKAQRQIELFAYELLQTYQKRMAVRRPRYPVDDDPHARFESMFQYRPTRDQKIAFEDVYNDMAFKDSPMDRLICGDVGFGKTEVALRALYRGVRAGRQVAFLTPTTVLANQQFHTVKSRGEAFGVKVALLTRFQTTKERNAIYKAVAAGDIDVLVGTHAILNPKVAWKDLGLVIIDEEQRFGVKQKEKLKARCAEVDVLTLSATPIPRTLNMHMSGLRDVTLITTPPDARLAIETKVEMYSDALVQSAIQAELDRGGQVFYVVPRIEGSDKVVKKLQGMFKGHKVLLGHGQMGDQLEQVMDDFAGKKASMLVSTTIIESGLDIPSVNTIIIDDAHMMGLAQLYQLRGRVGRSGVQAYAYMLHPAKGKLDDKAINRLECLKAFSDLGSGFDLARADMALRGVGNILGTQQHGDIEGVGVEMFQQMLVEYLDRIRGLAIHQVDDTDVQLDLCKHAFIPEDYIHDDQDRTATYQAFAMAPELQDLEELADSLVRTYGPLPLPALNLYKLHQIKRLASKIGIHRIRKAQPHVVLETDLAPDAVKHLMQMVVAPSRRAGKADQHFKYFRNTGIVIQGLDMVGSDDQVAVLLETLRTMQDALHVVNVVKPPNRTPAQQR